MPGKGHEGGGTADTSHMVHIPMQEFLHLLSGGEVAVVFHTFHV